MKQEFLRVFSLILACALLFAACSTATEPAGTGTEEPQSALSDADPAASAETESEAEAEEGLRHDMKDDVPDLDFGGAEFRSIAQDQSGRCIYSEELTGEALNDTVYANMLGIEERFNVDVTEPYGIGYNDISTTVANCVKAGDNAYELVLGQMETSGADALRGIYLNWHTIPYIDFDKPWWPKDITEVATVNGKMYVTVSDLSLYYAEQTWTIVYDKVAAGSYNVADLYETVRQGEWTIDRLLSVTGSIYTDLNGNGERDGDDYYGFCSAMNGCLLAAYLYGFDQRLASVSEDGQIEMLLETDKAASVFEALHKLHYESEGTLVPKSGTGNGDIYKPFVEGHALFCPIQFQYIEKVLREYENDFGVLPLPKWDENQSEYYSLCDAGTNIMAIPTTAENTDMIGAVVEAYSGDGWRTVLPTYYDVTLGAKAARDVESKEMMDLILANRIMDFAYLYDGWNGWVFKLAAFIETDGAFASKYKSNAKVVQKYYEKVLKFFNEG